MGDQVSEETSAEAVEILAPEKSTTPTFLDPSVWRVWVPAFILLGAAFACLYGVLTSSSAELIGPLVIAAAIFLCASLTLLALGGMHDGETRALFAFPAAVAQASKSALGLRKEYNRAISAAEGLQNAVKTEIEELRGIKDGAPSVDTAGLEARFVDALAERKAAEAATEEWQDRVVELVRSIERVLDADGLKSEYTSMAERTLADVERLFAPLQFSVIRPEPGAPLDSLLHEVVETEPSKEHGPGIVLSCSEWGFVIGSRRIPARVIVSD